MIKTDYSGGIGGMFIRALENNQELIYELVKKNIKQALDDPEILFMLKTLVEKLENKEK